MARYRILQMLQMFIDGVEEEVSGNWKIEDDMLMRRRNLRWSGGLKWRKVVLRDKEAGIFILSRKHLSGLRNSKKREIKTRLEENAQLIDIGWGDININNLRDYYDRATHKAYGTRWSDVKLLEECFENLFSRPLKPITEWR